MGFPFLLPLQRILATVSCILMLGCSSQAFGQGGAGGGQGGAGGGRGGAAGGAGVGTLPVFPIAPIGPGIGGGGIGIGGGPILPPGNIGGAVIDATVVADPGIVVGGVGQATVVVPTQTTAAFGGTQTASGNPADATYRWTITGGRITSDVTASTVGFTADSTGTVNLNVTAIANGTSYTTSAQVTVIATTAAGAMTIPATAAASPTATLSASVPAATNGDRTFQWAVSGDAVIVSGQSTPNLAFRPGSAGLKEVTCDVSLQNLATISLRSFVVVTGSGPVVPVMVTAGTGTGDYPGGTLVDIFADPPPAGFVFDRWTGTTAALGPDAFAARLPHAVVTVPAAPVTLTATYKAAPAWVPTTLTDFNPQRQTDASNRIANVATTLAYFIPAGARGLVFLLHATGGSAGGWFDSPEQLLLARDLVAAGYGVAALSSLDRTTGAWSTQSTLATNPDALNHAAALDRFVRDGTLAETKPVFLLGLASGADAAVRIAEFLVAANPPRPVKGVVLFCAASSETTAVTSTVPSFFALAANDAVLRPAGNASARANSQLMAGRGVATAVVATSTSPVQVGRFRALSVTSPDLTATDATAIWTALKTAGLLDPNNYLKAVPTADALNAAIPAAYQRRAADIRAQLAIAYAAQALYSETDARVIDFLDSRVASLPVPAPARVVNFSARGIIAYVGDSFTVGFNLSGTERTAILIRAAGPTLGRFGVGGALAAPRLEVYRGSTQLAANEGWDRAGNNAAQLSAAAASVGAFVLPAGALDAAVLLTLDPGSYTAVVKGVNGTIGGALAEVYDVGRNSTRLHELSTLAKINDAGAIVIPGFALQGSAPRTLMVRAVGPGLADFGLGSATVLGDPRLTVQNATGAVIAINDNWNQDSAAALTTAASVAGAFPLKVANGDAALVSAFAGGAYTLQASAAPPAGAATDAAATGWVLVEVYEVP